VILGRGGTGPRRFLNSLGKKGGGGKKGDGVKPAKLFFEDKETESVVAYLVPGPKGRKRGGKGTRFFVQ